MKNDYNEREKYKDKKNEVKTPDKDDRREKSESEKYADRIPTPQGSKK